MRIFFQKNLDSFWAQKFTLKNWKCLIFDHSASNAQPCTQILPKHDNIIVLSKQIRDLLGCAHICPSVKCSAYALSITNKSTQIHHQRRNHHVFHSTKSDRGFLFNSNDCDSDIPAFYQLDSVYCTRCTIWDCIKTESQ